MLRLTLMFLLLSQIALSQGKQSFDPLYWAGETKPENLISEYSGYDFSPLWLVTPNQYVIGIIGKEHQRIRVKILTVSRDDNDPQLYNVTGKSSVMGNVCDFAGTMRLTEIREFNDREVMNSNHGGKKDLVNTTGLLYGDYEFRENPTQSHVGIFSGIFSSIWYLDTLGVMNYNQLYIIDDYFNNVFKGKWISYEGNDERICLWADYDIPFEERSVKALRLHYMPDRKDYKHGWKNYVKAYRDHDKEAMIEEQREWWK